MSLKVTSFIVTAKEISQRRAVFDPTWCSSIGRLIKTLSMKQRIGTAVEVPFQETLFAFRREAHPR
jgi:hypothetical protein